MSDTTATPVASARDLRDARLAGWLAQGVREGHVDASEHLAHRGLLRGPREPETVKMLSAQIHSPFPDRSERAGTGHDRAHRDGEHPRQRIAHTSRVARIRNLAQHAQQGVIDVVEAGRGDRGRWHERVWSLSETACVGTPISAPRATPVTHATPITPRQTCRSKPPQPTFPGPCVSDHQPVSVFVELACERLDVGGDLGLQRRGQHLPSAVADDLIEQRPTSRLVGRRSVVNYLERGRTFPSRRANADPDPNLSMGFDLAREVPPLHLTSPRAIHRLSMASPRSPLVAK